MGKYTSKYTGQEIDDRLDAVSGKQDALVSGTNIKTVNGNSLLGSGNIEISGSGSGLPTITIALSQVISQNPLQIQLTDEQYQIATNNKQIIFDGTALGMDTVVADYAGSASYSGENYILFKFPYLRGFYRIEITTSTKVAEVQFGTVTVTQIDIDGASDSPGKVVTSRGDDVFWEYPYRMSYLNTAPSSANNTGTLEIVVLSSEPATKYDGYLYLIKSN